jgi:protein-disulfide isomerase
MSTKHLRTFLPFAIIPLLIGAAVMVGLPISQASSPDPITALRAAQEAEATQTPIVVTVEVTRVVTVVVTPTNTPLPPTPTTIPAEVTVDDDPFLGAADAPIKVVEFSDYQCGFCARFYVETLRPLTDRYGNLIQFVYRDFPIFGDASVLGAMSAECAGNQGKFWEYHNTIFEDHTSETPSDLTFETYQRWATELGLDYEQWLTCMNDPTTLDEIRIDALAGQEWGITGTPTFFINGVKLVGAHPLETFISLIDTELLARGIELPSGEGTAAQEEATPEPLFGGVNDLIPDLEGESSAE